MKVIDKFLEFMTNATNGVIGGLIGTVIVIALCTGCYLIALYAMFKWLV